MNLKKIEKIEILISYEFFVYKQIQRAVYDSGDTRCISEKIAKNDPQS